MDDNILREIVTRAEKGEQFAVGLLTHVQGSAPQKAGARLLVLPDGTMHGTVGGGCLEMETRRRALISLRTGEPALFDLRLDDDFGWDDGLICGGNTTLFVGLDPARKCAPAFKEALARQEAGQRSLIATILVSPDEDCVGATMLLLPEGGQTDPVPFAIVPPTTLRPTLQQGNGWRVLVESVRPRPHLIVMGCGHIGGALVELAASVGFDVTAVDDRSDFAHISRLPQAKTVVCEDMLACASRLPSGSDTYWVIVTRGHRNDGRVLAEIINRPSAYVGMIGSRRKVRIIREGLIKTGIATSERLAQIHSPVGLDIGAESPREIALSIAAQLIAVRHGKAV